MRDEIQNALITGNASHATALAEQWLRDFPPSESRTSAYQEATDAYSASRFLNHRYKMLMNLPLGRIRAHRFREVLEEISGNSLYWAALKAWCHGNIADSLAKELAGQNSYQLDFAEIIQLVQSLIETGNYQAAREAIEFASKINQKNPELNILAAEVYLKLNNQQYFEIYLREALFYKPEIILAHMHVLPTGRYRDTWDLISEVEEDMVIRTRNFALLLELNGIYNHRRRLEQDELARLHDEYQKLEREYNMVPPLRHELKPRILLHLVWLIIGYTEWARFDKTEDYRIRFREIDNESYQTFLEKNPESL